MYSYFSYDGPATHRRGRRTVPAEYDSEGQGDVPEQADDGSNTDIYLNMSSDGIEDDAAGEQSANVHITTILICSDNHIFI